MSSTHHQRRHQSAIGQLRARLRMRSRAGHWALVAVAVVATATLTERSWRGRLAEAEALREGWGASEQILVVTRTVEPGEPLGPVLAARVAPTALVPTDVLRAVPSDDATAAVPIGEGTMLTSQHVTGSANPLAALLDADERAVTISLEASTPGLRVGDPVDLVVSAPIADVASGRLIPGRLLRVDEELLVVAVGLSEVARVTDAAHARDIAVVLRPRPD